MSEAGLPLLLTVWACAILILFLGRARQKAEGTGLVAAYVPSLTSIHAIAPMLYLRDDYAYFSPAAVLAGEQ